MSIRPYLALLGGLGLSASDGSFNMDLRELSLCFVAGLLATPLAPVSKDLASALSAGVKVAQALRK